MKKEIRFDVRVLGGIPVACTIFKIDNSYFGIDKKFLYYINNTCICGSCKIYNLVKEYPGIDNFEMSVISLINLDHLLEYKDIRLVPVENDDIAKNITIEDFDIIYSDILGLNG